jgi:hypothetical protein
MSDALSPKSQAFLRSVQDADDPTRDDYDRVRAGVKARLAASVAAGVAALVTAKTVAASEAAVLTAVTATATTATAVTAVTAVTTASVGSGAAVPTGSAGVAFATKLVAVVLVVGAAAGGTTAVVGHQQAMHASAEEATTVHATADVPRDLKAPQARPPMPLPPTFATALATVEPPPTPPALTAPPAPAPSPAIATALTTETASAPSSLDAEIALVRDARAALRGGDAARALALLDEHTRRFSRGALAEDCDAERIYALCALGRSGEARSLASRFLTSHPASPHGASVRASCGGGTN